MDDFTFPRHFLTISGAGQMAADEMADALRRFLSQTEEVLKSIHPRRHTEYAGKMKELEDVFVFLGAPKVPYGTIAQISKATTIPEPTVREWRRRCLQDPSYRPYQNRNEHRLAFTREEEERIYRRLVSDFISQNKYCPINVIRSIALQEYGNEDGVRRFVCSNRWVKRFMKRWKLSFRKCHDRKRPPSVDDELVCRFHLDIDAAIEQHGREGLVNVDETSWRVIDHRWKTLAVTGAENVQCHWQSDPKMCVTAICGIDAAGGKLPVWVIADGVTERCEAKFREHPVLSEFIRKGELVITHSPKGWCNNQICIQYLKWLANFKKRPLFLVWDVFAAHRDDKVVNKAAKLDIGIGFIPPGMTDRYQPLDRRLFGAVKSRARARFDSKSCSPDHDPDLLTALETLVNVWRSVTQEEIIDAWDHLIDFS